MTVVRGSASGLKSGRSWDGDREVHHGSMIGPEGGVGPHEQSLEEGEFRVFFFSSRRRHTRFDCDWSSDVCSSDLTDPVQRVLESYLREKFPDIDAPIERRWAGIMGFSVDGLPLVGTLPDKPRVGDRKSVV